MNYCTSLARADDNRMLDPTNTQELYYLCKDYQNTLENDSTRTLTIAKGIRCEDYIAGFFSGFYTGFLSEIGRLRNEKVIDSSTEDNLMRNDSDALCIPEKATKNELIYTFIAYTAAHPETFSQSSGETLFSAFRQKFPCSK